MRKNFQLKARTADGNWYQFDIRDVPVVIGTDRAVLINKPNSPILDTSVILRGDHESGLFEGDVFVCKGVKWLVCYERGFYAINEQYTTKYLYDFKDYEVIGVADYEVNFPIPYKKRKQHLFKYGEILFYLSHIVMEENDGIVLRIKKMRVPLDDIQQECCMSYRTGESNRKLYLGDMVDDKPVMLRGGRICIETENGFLDLATGGVLDGYIS